MKGPVAPKDPVEKRPFLYLLLDKVIRGTKAPNGVICEHIFLEGRTVGQVQLACGTQIDEKILRMLTYVKDLRELVHSISVELVSENKDIREKEAKVTMICYGKTDKYTTGTHAEISVPCNGVEMEMVLNQIPVNEDDTILGEFFVELPAEDCNYSITIKLNLNDGFEVPEIIADQPVDITSENYRKMIQNSFISSGNNMRLKRVIERAKAGEDVTIGYIGGSITQGAGAKPINTECYAYKSYQAFCKRFGKEGKNNIHYVKAGIGGTSSELGVVRYEKDVLDNNRNQADLVIVEYAVNDNGDETKGVCYESLCKKILNAPNKPAVLLLFSVFMNDENLQDRLIPIGERYHLPMVSIKNALLPQYDENKVISKRQFFYDIFHPTNIGHTVMADCIDYLFEVVDGEEASASDIDLNIEPVYGTQFADVITFDRKTASEHCEIVEEGFDDVDSMTQAVERNMDTRVTPTFCDNWKTSGKPSASFSFELEFKNLFIVMKDEGAASYGRMDAFVDGKFIRTLNPLEIGWNHDSSMLLFDEPVAKKHKVELKMKEEDAGKEFTILAFAYSK